MLRYLYRDVLNGFIVILILFSAGEIVTLILLRIAGLSVDPQGGYVFLQEIETYFASFSFDVLHSIPRFLQLESFRALLAYFFFQLAALILLLRHLDSDQKEIARLRTQIAELTMTSSEKRKLNATFTKKTRRKWDKTIKKVKKWIKKQKNGKKKKKSQKEGKNLTSKIEG